MSKYNVVFEWKCGEKKGDRYWTDFESKSITERYYFTPINGTRVCDVLNIVAEGVTILEAERLCYETRPKLFK